MSSIDGDDDSDFDLQELMYDDSDFDLQELMYWVSSTGDVADGYDDSDEQVGNWTIVKDYETSIEVNSVDKHLFDVAGLQ